MSEQIELFKVEDSYNLANLKKICRDCIKSKYPKPVEEEDYLSYLEFLADETDLLFAEKIRKMADDIEARIYGKQKEVIQEVYACGKKMANS